MEAITIIQQIDYLKTVLMNSNAQDSLNKWKDLVMELDVNGKFDEDEFIKRLKLEEVVIKLIKSKILEKPIE
jgi:hypothetical protein